MIPMYEKVYGIDLNDGSEFDKLVAENFSQDLVDLFWCSDFVVNVYDGNRTRDPQYFGICLGVYDDVNHMATDIHDMANIVQQYKDHLAELEAYLFDPESDDVPLDERNRFFQIVQSVEPKVFVITGTS